MNNEQEETTIWYAILVFVAWKWFISYMASSWRLMSFLYDYGWTCVGTPIRILGNVCGRDWDFYIVLFRKMGFGHQEDVYFLDVEIYFYFFYALGEPVCIPRRCVVYVNYFTNLLSTAVRRFMSVLICSACLDKIVSNLVKDSCIFWLVHVLLCCLLWSLAFRYYFWLLRHMSFWVILQYSLVLHDFRFLVAAYL
jgi:hypothetical protein